jgi:hypothetical protein
MTTTIRRGLFAFVAMTMLATSGVAMTACERKKGPVEKAGEKTDKAMDNVSDAIDPKGPAEKAGRALDRATND